MTRRLLPRLRRPTARPTRRISSAIDPFLKLVTFEKGKATVKKLLSALVVVGLMAGLGCGGDTGPKKDDKKTGTGATGGAGGEKKESKPDTRKDL